MNTFIKKLNKHRPVLLILVLLSHVTFAESDFASGDLGLPKESKSESLIDSSRAATSTPAAPNLSPADAAELVRKKMGGQILNVNIQQRENGVIYHVKVLNSGRMKVINVDGQTGQLLNK